MFTTSGTSHLHVFAAARAWVRSLHVRGHRDRPGQAMSCIACFLPPSCECIARVASVVACFELLELHLARRILDQAYVAKT